MRAPIAVAAFVMVALLAGCNDINPYLGAAATQSSTIFYITPSSRPAGCSGFTLDIIGTGFVNDAVVSWNGSPRATNFESSGELLATINASDVATEGTVSIVVTTPPTGGQQNQGNNFSNIVSFGIGPAPTGLGATCPVPPSFPPTITALSASSGTAAGPNNNPAGTMVEIAGNYFGGLQNNSTVTFNGTAATVSSWSGTLIITTVPQGATTGDVLVTVAGVASIPIDPGANYFIVLASPDPAASALKSSAATANTIFSFSSTANPRYAAVVAPSSDLSSPGTGLEKVYLRDTCQGAPAAPDCSRTTTLVSVGFDGSDPDGASRSPSVSASGRFVAFASDANNLVADDANGVADIFLRDTCVGAPRGCVPTTTRISAGPDGVESNGASAWPSISPDGRFLAFDSAATNLVSDGHANAMGIGGGAFLWDSCFGVPSASGCTPSLTRLSVPSVAPHSH